MNKVTMLVKVMLGSLLCFGLSACQQSTSESTPWRVANAHIKELPPGQARAAVYMTLTNSAASDRHILNIEADIAGQAEVHRHSYENGMMKMRHVAHAQVPAGGSLVFEPGGYHIMLLDIAEPPAVGTEFSVTMAFDGGESLTFPVEVRPL